MIIGRIDNNLKYETIEIDLQGIETKKDLLYKVSKELNFPIWDENNWNAFSDWLVNGLYDSFDNIVALRIVLKDFSIKDEEVKRIFYEILEESADYGFEDNNGSKHIPCYYEILG